MGLHRVRVVAVRQIWARRSELKRPSLGRINEMSSLPHTSTDGMGFSKRPKGCFGVESSLTHLFFVGEWREEQGCWLTREHQVRHIRWGGGERAETLSICKQFGIWQRG
jgi:hypothetical protein